MGRSIYLPQDSDAAVNRLVGHAWQCAYGYMRSAESRATGESGQDYLALREHDAGLLFVVCDGVGQSYYGDFAARFVGDRLLDWLSDAHGAHAERDEAWMQQELGRFLLHATEEATAQLERHEMHPGVHGLLRDVLLDKKKQGSSAMYVGGRLDFPDRRRPDGALLLVWQGDIRLRLWTGAQEREAAFGGSFQTRHRWNSASGPVGGMPSVYSGSLPRGGDKEQSTLLVYSDGLAALDNRRQPPGGQLGQYIAEQAADPACDDMSVVQIDWQMDKEEHDGVSACST